MDFRLLGPLAVAGRRGPVRIAPGRESALLALLLVHRAEALSNDRIVDELWPDRAPENAAKGVQVYISRLRKALGPDRIETTAAGYRVRLAPDELDVDRFEALARAGHREEALALWHGEPLADFRYAPFAQAEARRLNELHNGLLSDLFDERLARGDTTVIPELESLIAREPLWERPRAQLMRSLYLAGRQSDALEVYRGARDLLGEQLGIDPSPELQRMERAILNHDPELGTPAPPPRPIRSRGGRLVLAGGLLVVTAAVAAGAILATRHPTARLATVEPNAVAAIDVTHGGIVAQIGAGERPSRLALSGGRLWVLNAGENTVDEIDLATYRRIGEFGPPLVPADIAASPGLLWIGDTLAVARFDAEQRRQVGGPVALPDSGEPPATRPPEERYLVSTPAGIWALTPADDAVRLDLRTGRVERVARAHVSSLAFGDGSLWGIDRHVVLRLDPRSGRVIARYRVPSLFYLGGLAAGGGFVFATSPAEGVVWRIDRRQTPVQTASIPVGLGVSSIAWGDGAAWVANRYNGEVDRIDPASLAVRRVATVPAPLDVAVGKDRVFVAAGAPSQKSGALAASACTPVDAGSAKPDLLIASDLPLRYSGRDPQSAVATIRAILRRRGFRAGRFRLGYQSCDDSTAAAHGSDESQCIANAGAYADDASVVAVVGTYDSRCAWDEIPILNRGIRGPLAMISPFNTGPFLTRVGYPGTVQTLAQVYAGGRSFFRVIAADHIQVAADAVLARRLGARRVAVVYDRAGMLQASQARWFVAAARRLGLTPLPVVWTGNDSRLARAIRARGADAAFVVSFVADSPDGDRELSRALGRVLAGRPVIVTDEKPLAAFAAGSGAVVYGSVGGLHRAVQLTGEARQIYSGLPLRFRDPYAVGETVEATDRLLDAIARSNGSRASIVRRLRSGFDPFGDPPTAPVAVYRAAADSPRWFTSIDPPARLVASAS